MDRVDLVVATADADLAEDTRLVAFDDAIDVETF